MFECFAVASEEKILSGRRPQLAEAGNIGAKDEVLSFQAAYFSDVRINDLDVRTDGIAPECIEIRAVEPVPCTFPSAEVRDDWYLSHEPFLCPDLLRPMWTPGKAPARPQDIFRHLQIRLQHSIRPHNSPLTDLPAHIHSHS